MSEKLTLERFMDEIGTPMALRLAELPDTPEGREQLRKHLRDGTLTPGEQKRQDAIARKWRGQNIPEIKG
ncbi:hypothetical protein [Caulobacter sp. UC70_42]|uniref:hypothetical protein n=1 Tax=Caulobacter sp. UC70_42 TaxID=3374551 RepID=UPI003757B0A7